MGKRLAALSLVLSFHPCGGQGPFGPLDGLPLLTIQRPQHMGRTYDRTVLGNLADPSAIAQLAVPHSDSFMIDVSVGTPPQKLKCLLDTGIADIWLPSNSYCKHKDHKDCGSHRFFNRSKSRSFVAKAPLMARGRWSPGSVRASMDASMDQALDRVWPLKSLKQASFTQSLKKALQNARGAGRPQFPTLLDGVIGEDNVSLGSGSFYFDNINQSFLLVHQDILPATRRWDGICGLGRQRVAVKQDPLWKRFGAKSKGQAKGGRAAVALFPGPGRLHYFVVGEVPYKACKPETLSWADTLSFTRGSHRNFWLIPGGLAIHREDPVKSFFLLDTGTSFLLAPPKKYLPFIRSLFAMPAFDSLCGWDRDAGNVVVCDCRIRESSNKLLPLRVYVGSRPFEIPIPELFVKVETGVEGESLCLLQIQRNPAKSPDPLDLFHDVTRRSNYSRSRQSSRTVHTTPAPAGQSGTLSPDETAALSAAETLAGAAAQAADQGAGGHLDLPGLKDKVFDEEKGLEHGEFDPHIPERQPILNFPGIKGLEHRVMDEKKGGLPVPPPPPPADGAKLAEEAFNAAKSLGHPRALAAKEVAEPDINEDFWIIGGVFLEKFVVVLDFEKERVGIAEPKEEVIYPYNRPERPPEDPEEGYLEMGVLQEQNAELRGMIKSLVREKEDGALQRREQEAQKNDLAADVHVLDQQNRELQNRIQTLEYSQEQSRAQYMELKTQDEQERARRKRQHQDLQALHYKYGSLQQRASFLHEENRLLRESGKRMELYLLGSGCFAAFLTVSVLACAWKVRRQLYYLWTCPEEGKMREAVPLSEFPPL